MTEDEKIAEQLEKYGLKPDSKYAEQIRKIIYQEINDEERESNELLKLGCIQLFAIGNVEDSLLIWEAKESNFDAHCYIDIELVCGAGLNETKEFLAEQDSVESKELLNNLLRYEESGDFDDFSVESKINEYKYYFYGNS